ncbi:MAG: pyridoxal phosphate-dependent aminotransferase [Clostridia bacterium]|nr:pyridoxal phosphate-dependent aminotransferase [Clostridia bacterium]
MKYNFDKIIDRKNTNSIKYDFAERRGKPADILPLWVADMDFAAPDGVIAELKSKAEHGIFGYSEPDDKYYEALCGWFKNRHGWDCDKNYFVQTCGVVHAICSLVRALTEEGDGVIICQPVYYPFASAVTDNGRKLVVSELKNSDGFYTVDFVDFEKKIADNKVKLFILCSPHNPAGRVWTKEELKRLGDICLKHGVFVISDEIHCDFTYGGNKHIVFPTVDKKFEKICAVCTAPSKTFNLAGLHTANIYIADKTARNKLVAELNKQGYSQPNITGLVACRAAYEQGGEWLDRLQDYLTGNLNFVREYLAENLPQIKLCEPQGTYLVWLDCRAAGMDDKTLSDALIKAGLWLDDGFIFGVGGSGFERINIACPRATLRLAMEKFKKAFN